MFCTLVASQFTSAETVEQDLLVSNRYEKDGRWGIDFSKNPG